MKAFRSLESKVAPLPAADVDTDQIIPKQFLKRVERSGYGRYLFHAWRFRSDGSPDPAFVLNDPAYSGAGILATGRNFGCGSSREHAAWALLDYGFHVVIAPSFADIFRANCHRNGIVPVELPENVAAGIADRAVESPGYALRVDLEECRVSDDHGLHVPFLIDEFRRRCLLEGWDEIGLTLRHEDAIARYEAAREES